jgi:hypothetical protein
MCDSEVPIPVCILGYLAYFKASAATSISFFTALVSPHTVAFYNQELVLRLLVLYQKFVLYLCSLYLRSFTSPYEYKFTTINYVSLKKIIYNVKLL